MLYGSKIRDLLKYYDDQVVSNLNSGNYGSARDKSRILSIALRELLKNPRLQIPPKTRVELSFYISRLGLLTESCLIKDQEAISTLRAVLDNKKKSLEEQLK